MKLKSFGCSFIYGSELSQRTHTWPSVIAQRLGLDHENHGIEGAGNLRIMESILTHANKDDICVVKWSWIDRFDIVQLKEQQWHTEQWHTLVPSDTDSLASFYYRNLHSQYRDMLTNLLYIKTAQDYLNSEGVLSLMTYMDSLLFEPINDDWHDRRAVTFLQQSIISNMVLFNDMTFLQWSRSNNYAESQLWHPLDEAHKHAADLMFPQVQALLKRKNKRS